MDYNQIAQDIVAELKSVGRRTDAEIAERLGISRQAYIRRRNTDSLTTENITVLSAWLITAFGGGFYLNKYFSSRSKKADNMPDPDFNIPIAIKQLWDIPEGCVQFIVRCHKPLRPGTIASIANVTEAINTMVEIENS